ncbi:MAG: hypothetical protein K2F58_01060, partial [Muribaculaceae bacterium]|nr:hypothetical protein [Muribaculaceae bacterium]
MNNRLLITALIAYCSISASFTHAATTDLTGAWNGPKDLMINFCLDSQNQPYVCWCGIFRTCGWMNLSTTFSNDSIIIISDEAGLPFEGRFKIESNDRLEGVLAMGNPGDEWYYNDSCELIRQKPEMPENLNRALEGTILPADYRVLSHDLETAQEVLATITPRSYGYAEKKAVESLLTAQKQPVPPE